MYLKRLEIQGFKTFATRTVFEFRPGITAVVGPNGSGKSNIADAVRWVLGEQSYAALRSKRTEDLLFSGGGRRAPAGLAEVSLTIDNSDRLLPLPYGEVVLTRRATRAGENEYFINRNRVRLRDVQEAIGPLGGSYTIINQGLVDSALTLRPEERRRLFEDAAEISVFESRKADAARKLRETAANLERCADVLAELEPRLRSLKRQAGLARSYRELTEELRGLLLQHYAVLWRNARQGLAAAAAAEQRLVEQLQSRRAAQSAATFDLRAVRDQLRTLRERLGALHAESSALHTRAEAIQRELAVGNERQAALTRRGEEFERGLQEFDLRREELEGERATIAERLADAEARLAAQRASAAALEDELAARETERRAAQRALDAAQRAEVEAGAALAERRRRSEQLAAQRERMAHEQVSYAESLQAAESALAGVKAAMQWAEAQGRAGFVLVSSILRTPAQLETAIEVALGSRLQNIVVERWADAEDTIAALKRGGQGRATFLPLDTLRPPTTDDRRPAGAGILGVATDLVEFDEHYRPVAQNLLGRTLIVADLPTARQTLRQLSGGWALVTLAGEQVSSGGAITGGAQTKETGTLRRERELRELPDQMAALRDAVVQATQARAALDPRISAAERELREAESARQRSAQEHEAQRAAIDKTRRAADQAAADQDLQRRRHDQNAAGITDLSDQQAALEQEQAVLAAREAAAHDQLARLRAEDQGRLDAEREVQQRMATLRSDASAAEGAARAERALLQSNRQSLARLEDQRAAGLRRIDELVQEREVLEAQLHAHQSSHAALLAQIDALRAQIGPAESELAALETAQADMERREAELTSALLAAESAHGRAAVDVQRARDRIDAIWERAAADDIDIEGTGDWGLGAGDWESAESLESKIQNLKNPLALEEYDEASERYTFLTTQTGDLRQAELALRELIAELDSAMQARFETTFRAVAAEFERSFIRLFGGGQAQLLLTRSNGSSDGDSNGDGNGENHAGVDGLGVEILARPPGKRQQTLSLLSGGERTLTAAALLFAILKVNPSPFCVLDEVDAALDEANVGRFREALADLSQQTQFLLITHNRGTIEVADTIYGVSMGEDGASQVFSLRLEEMVED